MLQNEHVNDEHVGHPMIFMYVQQARATAILSTTLSAAEPHRGHGAPSLWGDDDFLRQRRGVG